MQLLAPDILTEARGLPVGVSAISLVMGLVLWMLGGRSHRFWLVLVTTLVAGVIGLYSGPAYGAQPLVSGLLLAVAAGALALPLVRVVAFAAGGATAWVVLHAMAPTWDEPLVSFVAGGLVGLVLFRVWMMALTSILGTLLVGYSSLCLADKLGKLDAVGWAEKHTGLLNWGCAGLAGLGLLVQFILDRRQARKEWEQAEKDRERAEKEKEKAREKERKSAPRRTWWSWVQPGYRRAG